MAHQRMAREISAGGVVLRRMQNRWWIAVIEPQSSREKREARGKTVWALPKGWVDAGEEPSNTAIREVREETGVNAEVITKLTDIKYVYVRTWGDGARVFKVVSFFLLVYRSGELGDIPPEMRKEVRRVEWLPLEDAARVLSYSGEKQVAKMALEWVSEHPEIEVAAK